METLGTAAVDLVTDMATAALVTLERPPKGKRHAPSPPTLRLTGHLPDIAGNPIPPLERWWRIYGDVVRLRFATTTGYLVSHPDAVRQVLQENHRNYSKGSRGVKLLSLVLGHSLLTSEGDFWLRQRRIAQPAFHKQRIAGFYDLMVKQAEAIADGWANDGSGKERDITQSMMRYTLKVIAECTLGVDMENEVQTVSKAMNFIVADIEHRLNEITGQLIQLPTERNRLFRAHVRSLDEVVSRVIQSRRRGGGREDFLGMLLEARDEETGEQMSDENLRDEVITMLLAGHETTANLLNWAFYLLSLHPEVREKVEAEVDRVLGDEPMRLEHYSKLEYTSRVLSETLRLYSPVWMIERWAEGPDEIGGYFIPKGSTIYMSPWIIHRRADFWQNPLVFDPDRFLKPLPHKYALVPFGGGPRLCIGKDFALMEARVALATIVRRFRLELVPNQKIDVQPQVTLRPRNGLRMTLHARK